jgi:rod shape-determining protein MreD
MSSRSVPFRGSFTSREQVSVYEFSWIATILIPLVAIITDTIIGYMASSLGVKIDIENPGSRFLIIYGFFVIHQAVYYGVGHGLLRQALQWSWSHVAISALANAAVGVLVFNLLDRFKQR